MCFRLLSKNLLQKKRLVKITLYIFLTCNHSFQSPLGKVTREVPLQQKWKDTIQISEGLRNIIK